MPNTWTEQDITDALAEANAYLKAARARVSLLRRGEVIYYQGTFPPKPGSKRVDPHQQQIASRLPCSKWGIKKARAEAVTIGASVVAGKFTWNDWPYRGKGKVKTAADWIAEFEQDYRSRHELRDASWVENWAKYYGRLPQGKELTAENILAVVTATRQNSAARRRCCLALGHLAEFAGLELDLTAYRGNYGRGKERPKELPSDEEIAFWCGPDSPIKHQGWRRIIGLIAAYGLRPHEAMLGRIVEVMEPDHAWVFHVPPGTKTGAREVRAFYPEWPDAWQLWAPHRPKVNVKAAHKKGRLGQTVWNAFRRYGVPFEPYDLRHGFALRVHIGFQLPGPVGAQLMGHSPDEHLRTYQKYLDADRAAEAIDRAIARDDRPLPPKG